uniref:Uncharacterized protein n=1 Tax=Daphnia galeata TaxID=27404 RepID=A0A8J2S4T6_9CRUS|nr:unnamed protein product [Daphnia galeata]
MAYLIVPQWQDGSELSLSNSGSRSIPVGQDKKIRGSRYSIRRCATKITSDEQRAKAREHQKRWREKLKTDVAKSAEYREMQRERTRMWKEKMKINEAERFGEISRKHQEQCKKWWDKLTPEQRREKRKQYNLKWRQNQKKGDSDSSDSKETDNWQSYKSYNQTMSENNSGPKAATPLTAPDYYSVKNRYKIPFKEEPLHRNTWILQAFPFGPR